MKRKRKRKIKFSDQMIKLVGIIVYGFAFSVLGARCTSSEIDNDKQSIIADDPTAKPDTGEFRPPNTSFIASVYRDR